LLTLAVIRSILGPSKIHSMDLLDICWTCSYLYLAHSHCDKKYVNLRKWLWCQNFYFRQKSQLFLGQNISSSPLKNKWSPHHVLTLHAMRNSKKSKWLKTSENDFQILQHTCIGNNPLGPFRNLYSHIVSYHHFRHQLPVRRGHRCTMETFLLVIQF
jgi:hypothetical protein